MAVDLSAVKPGAFKTVKDFQIEDALNAAKIAKLQQESVAAGGHDPAAVKIVNEMQLAAAKANDANLPPDQRAIAAHRYNLLNQVAKSYAIDRGMNAEVPSIYGSQPPAPAGALPAPAAGADPQQEFNDALAGLDAQGALSPATGTVPRRDPMPLPADPAGGGVSPVKGFSDIAAAQAGQKKGAESQAQKNVELEMNPKIERETKLAELRAGEEFGLPSREGAVEKLDDLLTRIENHPGLAGAVGVGNPFSGKIPLADAGLPGSPVADFFALADQLKGSGFLEAIQQMKGLGALSNQEGDAATKAYAALSTSQSEKQYRDNLAILRLTMKKGLERSYQKAGVQRPAADAPAADVGKGAPLSGAQETAKHIFALQKAGKDKAKAEEYLRLKGVIK